MTNKYFHNPRCSKSRQGLEIIESQGLDFEVVEYLKTGISQEQFLEIIKKSGKEPLDGLIRVKEAIFKELELKGKSLDHSQWAKVVSKNPKLLERPIFLSKKNAIIGRPPENFLKLS